MIHTTQQQNSEQALMNQIFTLADAGGSVIQVRTREPMRTALVLRKSILQSGDGDYAEWDLINGFRRFTLENYTNNIVGGDEMEFTQALMKPLLMLRDAASSINANKDKVHYFIFVNPHSFLVQNPYTTELIQQYAGILPLTNVCIIMITPDTALEDIPVGTVLLSEMNCPSAEELQDVLSRILENAVKDFEDGSSLTEEDIRKVSYLGLGLTLYEFETYSAIAIIEANTAGETEITVDTMIKGISQGKTAVVKQSEILELYPSDSMDNVGGMAKLKDWVASRAGCYSEEAQEFGIEAPKGIVLVGVPGAGKSLVAKAVSSVLGVPLVRMDFGRVFSKFVGDSESRVRSALDMVASMAPCVLFVDEIDKGLGGIGGGGGDSGTSSRVLGSFLTWLQDNKSPVFVMVTANKVDGLPPELLRRGRFDAIFSVTLPSPAERIEVLQIHLRKRNQSPKFSATDLATFDSASEGYVPAEIESAVKEGLIMAFNDGKALNMQHIIAALEDMVPLSKSYAPQIDAMVKWARNNATPVNYDDKPAAPVQSSTRRIATRRPPV